jgi:hypothetical protein
MKKNLLLLMAVACLLGCSGRNKELFELADKLVQSLETTHKSYGVLGGSKHAVVTSDGLYSITPIGRLVNVKILKAVEDSEYEDLKAALQEHYKNESRVNNVYINRGGTIMIDCRN